ncbi:MAG: hypothetical protein E7404_06510 [Ruminococcaceae bacterium]|nr:hypothetical protein [Oscillospiraceae bacterium]
MTKRILCIVLSFLLIFPAFSAFAKDDTIVPTKENPVVGGTEEMNEYMRWFNSRPLHERDSSEVIYPDDMRTLFSEGRKESVKQEEFEKYMTTEMAPWLKSYHMTTEQQIYQGEKGGEWGQLIFSIAASPYDKNVILFGNDTAGIYRSDDAGKTWRQSSDGLMGLSVNTILWDPDYKDTVYALMTGSKDKGRFGYLGVYKSEDNGYTWRHLHAMNGTKRVSKFLTFGMKNEKGQRPLFAGSNDISGTSAESNACKGIFRSYDRGETWESIGDFQNYPILNIHAFSDTELVVACVQGLGLMVSYDSGDTWENITSSIPLDKGDSTEETQLGGYNVAGLNAEANTIEDVAINPYDKNHWIAATHAVALYESKDAGKSWEKIPVDFGEAVVRDTVFVRTVQFSNKRVNGKTRLFLNMYSTTETVRISDDYGRTYTIPDYHQEKAYFEKNWHTGWFSEAIEFSPFDENVVYIGRGSTFRISTDGGINFYPSSSGYSGAAAWDFHFRDDGSVDYVAMIDTGMWRLAEGYEGPYTPVKDASRNKPNCSDGGAATGIAVDPNDKNHIFYVMGGDMYGRSAYVFESNDALEHSHYIESVREIIDKRKEDTGKASALSNTFIQYHNEDDNVIYTTYFRSYDNGKTWHENAIRVRAICVQDNDILYGTQYSGVVDDKRLFISYDRGETWLYTGIVIPVKGQMRTVIADTGEKGVLWCYEYSQVIRIDLKTGKVEVKGSAANGISILEGQRLEGQSLWQNPKNPKHLLVSARDIDRNSIMATFETIDGGESWHILEGMPPLVGVGAMNEHPTLPLVYFGTMMGTVVYDYSIYHKYLNGELEYDGNKNNYQGDSDKSALYEEEYENYEEYEQKMKEQNTEFTYEDDEKENMEVAE